MAFNINKDNVEVLDYDFNIFTGELEKRYTKGIFKDDLYEKNLSIRDLSLCSYSFVFKNISRYMSTLIMELQDSYTEQSLRYCVYDDSVNGYIRDLHHKDDLIPENVRYKMDDMVEIYKELIQLKDDIEIKGRPKREHYKYNVLPEEARNLLPVSVVTNMMITLDGGSLIGLYRLFNKNLQVFQELKNLVSNTIGSHSKLYEGLSKLTDIEKEEQVRLFTEFSISEPSQMISSNPINRIANATRISSNQMFNTLVEPNDEKDIKLTLGVLGCGHTSVSEHTHISFASRLTAPGYQQLIRHRHHKVSRVIGTDSYINNLHYVATNDIDHVVDVTLFDNIPKAEDYLYNGLTIREHLIDYIDYMREWVCQRGVPVNLQLANLCMLNIFPIDFNVSGNLLATSHVAKKRICNNAQSEISNLYRLVYTSLKNIDNKPLNQFIDKHFVPSCVSGKCGEGKMTCGNPLTMENITTER